jgi:hypothetical protein
MSIIANNTNLSSRKCSFQQYSFKYAENVIEHDQTINNLEGTDRDTLFNIKLIFHYMAPVNTYNVQMVNERVHDVVLSLNNDFNNYSENPNIMNNLLYNSTVNKIFMNNIEKQKIYFNQDYTDLIPNEPSNIVFSVAKTYFYPVTNKLNLSAYNDTKDAEIEIEVIHQFINNYRACSIYPDSYVNVWVIDYVGSGNMGFSSFPWESSNFFKGIVINKNVFFPEETLEKKFNLFKTLTHQFGHFFGLLHVCRNDTQLQNVQNIHEDEIITNYTYTPPKLLVLNDDPSIHKQLQTDVSFNPLFMNFMDQTIDKYVSIFTENQIQSMRIVIANMLSCLIEHAPELPEETYFPDMNVSKIIDAERVQTVKPAEENSTFVALSYKHFSRSRPFSIK